LFYLLAFAVGSDKPARRVVHGLHEHLSVPATTRQLSEHDDRTRGDGATPGCSGQSDGYHSNSAPQRRYHRRTSQGERCYV